MGIFWSCPLRLVCTASSFAQKEKREPLTGAQIEQIREAGIYPDDRVSLYTKFIDEHAETIKGLTARGKSGSRAQRLDGELQDLTALMDELGTNLDVYSDRKADIRKALKGLNDAAPRWLGILRALAGEPGFELARKEAIESGEDLADSGQAAADRTDRLFQRAQRGAGAGSGRAEIEAAKPLIMAITFACSAFPCIRIAAPGLRERAQNASRVLAPRK